MIAQIFHQEANCGWLPLVGVLGKGHRMLGHIVKEQLKSATDNPLSRCPYRSQIAYVNSTAMSIVSGMMMLSRKQRVVSEFSHSEERREISKTIEGSRGGLYFASQAERNSTKYSHRTECESESESESGHESRVRGAVRLVSIPPATISSPRQALPKQIAK
jgi:hypothetical protein